MVDRHAMVEDSGELHTISFYKDCYNLRPDERKDLVVSSRYRKLLVIEKRSRGKLAACLCARGLEQKIMEIHAAKKIYAKNLLKEAAEAIGLGKEWLEVSPYKEELPLCLERRNMQLPDMLVRKAVKAGRAGDWSVLVKSDELSPLDDGRS